MTGQMKKTAAQELSAAERRQKKMELLRKRTEALADQLEEVPCGILHPAGNVRVSLDLVGTVTESVKARAVTISISRDRKTCEVWLLTFKPLAVNRLLSICIL